MDERIRTLIENGVKQRHRSMFVIIGDKSRDQVRFFIILFSIINFKLLFFLKVIKCDNFELDLITVFAFMLFCAVLCYADCESSLYAEQSGGQISAYCFVVLQR